jgi:hypothetical protein
MDIKSIDEKNETILITGLNENPDLVDEKNETTPSAKTEPEVPSKTWERIQNKKRKRASLNLMNIETKSPTLDKEDPTYNMNKLNVEIQTMYDEMTQKKIGKLAVQEEAICESIKVADILIGQFNKYRNDVENGKTISLDQYGEEVGRFKKLFEKVTLTDPNTYNPFPEGVDLENVDEETLIGFVNDLTNFVESKQFDLTKISRDLKTAIEFHLQVSMITSARVGKESDIDRMVSGQVVRG